MTNVGKIEQLIDRPAVLSATVCNLATCRHINDLEAEVRAANEALKICNMRANQAERERDAARTAGRELLACLAVARTAEGQLMDTAARARKVFGG